MLITPHKQKRLKNRSRWKKIKKLDEQLQKASIKPLDYDKLKKYELKKQKQNKNIKSKNKFNVSESSHISKINLNRNIDFKDKVKNIIDITNQINGYLKNFHEKKFIINHKIIEDASIAGILYLVGQISKIQKAKLGSSEIRLKYIKQYGLQKNKYKLQYLFYKIGYWKYFGIRNKPYRIVPSIQCDYFLSIETNNKSDIKLLNNIKKFINNNVNFLKNDYEIEYRFDDILKEAMGNSIEHAYSGNFDDIGKDSGKWWVCGHYDRIDNTLELVFYDYGIGIRNSMKKNLGEDAHRGLFDKLTDTIKSDADIIEMAVNGDLSKYKNYKEQDRGKGFKRFQNFAKSLGYNCELTIVSNKGKYQFKYDSIHTKDSVKKTVLHDNIDGTLVKWKIELSQSDRKDSSC